MAKKPLSYDQKVLLLADLKDALVDLLTKTKIKEWACRASAKGVYRVSDHTMTVMATGKLIHDLEVDIAGRVQYVFLTIMDLLKVRHKTTWKVTFIVPLNFSDDDDIPIFLQLPKNASQLFINTMDIFSARVYTSWMDLSKDELFEALKEFIADRRKARNIMSQHARILMKAGV